MQDETIARAEGVLSLHSLWQLSSEVQLPSEVQHPERPAFHNRPTEVVTEPQQLVRSPGMLDGQPVEQRHNPACSGSGSGSASGSDRVARLNGATLERQQHEQWECYGHCGANVRHFCQDTSLM